MTCEEALEAISAALDGELSRAERAKLSGHLLECPECRALAEDLRVLTDILEDCEQAPPPQLAASIRRAIAAETAKPVPAKRRKAPYLRTVAAMLALCVCLGGIGLFAAGQNKDMSGGAANEAAPATFKAGGEAADGAPCEIEDNGAAGEFEPNAAPMEPAEMPAGRGEAPVPSPSSAPAAPDVAVGGANSKGTADDPDSGTDGTYGGNKVPITPEEALELVFEYLGGYEEYPDAQLLVDDFGGYDAPVYYLETVETDTGTWQYRLDYDSLSDGESYLFHLYYELVSGGADDVGHTATMNWIEVSVDGGNVAPVF